MLETLACLKIDDKQIDTGDQREGGESARRATWGVCRVSGWEHIQSEQCFIYIAVHQFFQSELNYFAVGLGEQSFKDADVLSEKINFSAPGGPKSTIFDTDDVDPLYFEVSIVSAPSDPPYMSKNGKMCYFYHFLRVPKKTYTQSTGLPWKI